MMNVEHPTFAMIKPDAVAANNSGKIIDMIEHNGFEIMLMQKAVLSKELAEEFYSIHKERPFFGELVDFITSGPVIAMMLFHKENAVDEWRKLIGATNPKEALSGTVRHAFGTDVGKNAVHGSDSDENAFNEMQLMFPEVFADFMAEMGANESGADDECCDDEDDCCEDDVCNG